jgi:peroxiredoxin
VTLLTTPSVGDPAPELDLPTLTGDGPLRIEDIRGRPVILTFLRHAG